MNFRRVSLRIKVALMLGGGMLFALGTVLLTLFLVMQGDFDRIARELADQRTQRVAHFLLYREDFLRSSVADNAIWDETYDFVTSGREGYFEKNYFYESGVSEPYDFVLVYDVNRRFLGGMHLTSDGYESKPPPGLDPDVLARSALMRAPNGASGLLGFGSQAVILASHDILPTSGEGASAGTLVYGIFVSPALLADLRATTGVSVTITPPSPALDPGPTLPLPAHLSAFSARLLGNWSNPAGPEAWLTVKGLDARPLLLRLRFEPAHFADLVRRPNLIVAALAASAVLLIAGALLVIEINVLRSVASLDRQMAAVAEDPANGRIHLEGSQEFSRLTVSANRMIEALREQQSALAAERSLLHSVFDAAAEGLLAFRAQRDPSGHITDFIVERANPAGCSLLNIPIDQSIGWSVRTALDRAGVEDAMLHAFSRTVLTGEPQHIVRPCPLAGNRWLDCQIAPWGDGVVICLSDVTPQRESEQKLRSSLAELERFNRAMLGREERILEIKREVNALATAAGKPAPYLPEP